MKFLCKTEFFHSGNRLYTPGNVYDFTAEAAGKLIAADENIPLGALSFFTPVDLEAMNFVKDKKGDGTATAPVAGAAPAPEPPTRAALVAEAKNLGIKGANFMNEESLKRVIEAAKTNQAASPEAEGGNTQPPQG